MTRMRTRQAAEARKSTKPRYTTTRLFTKDQIRGAAVRAERNGQSLNAQSLRDLLKQMEEMKCDFFPRDKVSQEIKDVLDHYIQLTLNPA